MEYLVFSGPLFIIGMPRSGTKLLRDLLNGHTNFAIPVIESHFIPYLYRKFGNFPEFGRNCSFDEFYNDFRESSFVINMKQLNIVMKKEDFGSITAETTLAEIFEDILKYYAPKNLCDNRIIWGDKTPGYLKHMGLLKKLFPQARFLHIIRDPRDYALSVSNAWGKSRLRAADRWRKTLSTAREDGNFIGDDYLEVFYESLLDSPEQTLTLICKFLDVNYENEMTILSNPTENLGDAKGYTTILKNNKQKYFMHFSPAMIKRIEELVYPVLSRTQYDIHFAQQYRPLSKPHQFILKVFDGLASAIFHIKDKGLVNGIRYFTTLHRRSSWR